MSRPEWLYAESCCEQWTPESGCPHHTGRSAMGLPAREFYRPGSTVLARTTQPRREARQWTQT